METSLMEQNEPIQDNPIQHYQLEFHGKGSEYFSIMIVNWLLTLVTLGLYYPWARAKKLRYVYGNTALNNEYFHFSGTGKEMFKGFIKIILLYFAILAIFAALQTLTESPFLAILFIYLAIFGLIPFAIHGSFRYRMSRTSYRGIRFGYRGNRNELVVNFYKWVFFTLITLGIYGAWMQMNIRRYTHQNIRYGDVVFDNHSDGTDWFFLNLKGYFLTIFTFGIYAFWWQRDIFNYYYNSITITKGEQEVVCSSTATGGGFFSLLVGNFFITVLTLGLGKAWADMRTQQFICDNVKLEGNINMEEIHQTEEEYTDAFGEDAMDFFEIDLA